MGQVREGSGLRTLYTRATVGTRVRFWPCEGTGYCGGGCVKRFSSAGVKGVWSPLAQSGVHTKACGNFIGQVGNVGLEAGKVGFILGR